MVSNAPKRYETHQNISLGSNGVDRMCSLRKILTRHHGTNYGTNSARFTPSFVTQPNSPKCNEIVQNTQNISLGSSGVDRVSLLRKVPTRLRGTNFCTSSAYFAPSFVTQPNGPQCTQIVQNAAKHQFMVHWDRSGVFVAINSNATSWHELLH